MVLGGMEEAFLEPHLDGGIGVIGEGLREDFFGGVGEGACFGDHGKEGAQGAQGHLCEVLGKRKRGEVVGGGFEQKETEQVVCM